MSCGDLDERGRSDHPGALRGASAGRSLCGAWAAYRIARKAVGLSAHADVRACVGFSWKSHARRRANQIWSMFGMAFWIVQNGWFRSIRLRANTPRACWAHPNARVDGVFRHQRASATDGEGVALAPPVA